MFNRGLYRVYLNDSNKPLHDMCRVRNLVPVYVTVCSKKNPDHFLEKTRLIRIFSGTYHEFIN